MSYRSQDEAEQSGPELFGKTWGLRKWRYRVRLGNRFSETKLNIPNIVE